jgi:hypothetical protein
MREFTEPEKLAIAESAVSAGDADVDDALLEKFGIEDKPQLLSILEEMDTGTCHACGWHGENDQFKNGFCSLCR